MLAVIHLRSKLLKVKILLLTASASVSCFAELDFAVSPERDLYTCANGKWLEPIHLQSLLRLHSLSSTQPIIYRAYHLQSLFMTNYLLNIIHPFGISIFNYKVPKVDRVNIFVCKFELHSFCMKNKNASARVRHRR